MTRVVVLQPGYLPWLGFFDQMARSDVFVIYDDVQFDKHGWRNRNRIKSSSGIQWLTVPVVTSGRPLQLVKDVEIDTRATWGRKHLSALKTNYARAPYFNLVYQRLEPLLSQPWTSLLEVDLALMHALCELLGLKPRVLLSSDLKVEGGRVERLVSICQRLEADAYLSGAAAGEYLKAEMDLFDAANIKVEMQNYKHPEYPQLYGPFVPYLSVVDLLFMCGPDSLGILTS